VDNPIWLEPVLERHLVQVSAPDALWHRIQHPRPVETQASRPKILLVLTAAAVVAAAVWSVFPRRADNAVSGQAAAVEALTRQPEDLDFRSDTVSEIRVWVKARTGLDLPLPDGTARAVRLTGVCAVKGGTPAVEVSYRVRGHNAALVVSKARSAESAGDAKHHLLKCESVAGTRVSSWTMRGQLYTLAFAVHGDARDECLLCHSGAEQLTN
jgi:hypothetical protein